jgi:peptidoglycan/LPS O-acetylase OafA/YrhL
MVQIFLLVVVLCLIGGGLVQARGPTDPAARNRLRLGLAVTACAAALGALALALRGVGDARADHTRAAAPAAAEPP